jgi:hypothetical protein
MLGDEYIRHDDKPASRLAPKGLDGLCDFYVVMNGRNILGRLRHSLLLSKNPHIIGISP